MGFVFRLNEERQNITLSIKPPITMAITTVLGGMKDWLFYLHFDDIGQARNVQASFLGRTIDTITSVHRDSDVTNHLLRDDSNRHNDVTGIRHGANEDYHDYVQK